MSTTTTARFNLVKPVAGSGEPVDVQAHLDDNWDKVDAALGIFLCTSTTRPSSPGTGQQIYETDSGFGYVWNGSAWKRTNYNKIQAADVTATETTSGGVYADLTTPGPTLTNIPLIAGNAYTIIVSSFSKNSNIAAVSKMGFAVSGVDTVAASDDDAAITRNTDEHTCERTCTYTPATTGNHTIKAVYSSSGGATASFTRRRLAIA